ncbi:PhoPQ-activated pathogenicity-related protein [Oxalobacteraceae bacterium GrIS 2.11]
MGLRGQQISAVVVALMCGCSAGVDQSPVSAQSCFENSGSQFSEVMSCYRSASEAQALVYSAGETTEIGTIQKRTYALTSQSWSPNGMVLPAQWKHDVDIYIPADARTGSALLVVNNGLNVPGAQQDIQSASDLTETTALSIAQQTRTIVVSVSNVPNQYLTYSDDGLARREDSSVAHSWNLFIQSPESRPFQSLHVPMMASIVKAMDLVQQELRPWNIQTFIATGASKRAWGTWFAALSDTRITAIVPFVIDILSMDQVLEHTFRTYGGNWPLAFADYYLEGITAQRQTANFDKLLQIEDPLRYLDSRYADRLAIPKYIVNASGDDFFVPDNTRFYLDQLPGPKALRVAPNSDHYGIRNHVESSLIPFINRVQQGIALPAVDIAIGAANTNLEFSELPIKIVQWRAVNPTARDFRLACGIRYAATSITPAQKIAVALTAPETGWQASFVEAQFADGFILTTPVKVVPDTYPVSAPDVIEPGCKTIAEASPV